MQTYCRELVRSLSATTKARLEAVVQADAVGDLPDAVRPRVRPVAPGVRRAALGALPVRGADLVHGLDVDLPVLTRAATVTTVHDTSVFDVPWAHPPVRVRGERLLMRRNLARADAVVAVSAFTAERIAALFGRTAVVTPLAPGPTFRPPDVSACHQVRQRYDLPGRFVLHVGTVEPRKDVALLGAACRALRVPLLLAGAVAPGSVLPAGAVRLGYVPLADLPALYAQATVVGYPSRYEGFGLPPVEALASGAVVVASRVGALPEMLGDVARLVTPGDLDELTAVLRELLNDDDARAHLRRAGLARATGWSWSTTADQTLEVYRSLGVDC